MIIIHRPNGSSVSVGGRIGRDESLGKWSGQIKGPAGSSRRSTSGMREGWRVRTFGMEKDRGASMPGEEPVVEQTFDDQRPTDDGCKACQRSRRRERGAGQCGGGNRHAPDQVMTPVGPIAECDPAAPGGERE